MIENPEKFFLMDSQKLLIKKKRWFFWKKVSFSALGGFILALGNYLIHSFLSVGASFVFIFLTGSLSMFVGYVAFMLTRNYVSCLSNESQRHFETNRSLQDENRKLKRKNQELKKTAQENRKLLENTLPYMLKNKTDKKALLN